MADLHIEQCYDKTPRSYLERIMELKSQIFDIDSRLAANLFVRGLLKGLLLHERFLENRPHDLNELKSREKGIFRVVESRQQIARNAAIAISQNKLRSKGPNNTNQRMKDYKRIDKSSRDRSRVF